MILWMRQKCVKNGIIKSKLYIYIDIEVINKIHRDRDRDRDSKVLSDLVLVYSELVVVIASYLTSGGDSEAYY